jgi:hypothetical protein
LQHGDNFVELIPFLPNFGKHFVDVHFPRVPKSGGGFARQASALNLCVRLLAPFHFLHHGFIVGYQHSVKARNLFAPQCRDESSQRSIEGGSALRADAVAQEQLDYVSGFMLVCFHTPSVRRKTIVRPCFV